ncbi:putative guanyl-specific ribonuclease [Gordonia effusa NBRC 100432]|uniref:Putative guanyl-specific ribonuclease n=1 Tax=Gordonia effusa NBRC 100432 TaxID=1077974 RepID=H0QXP7_9ACTN|nr:putative guanyl-specific ribonuclease [Gordonia effusa NBRC 100432]
MPARVSATLALIDAGRWPEAANAPGTQGGRTFRNNEGRLPRKAASGKAMRYQEWDVNAKAPNRGRDAERIITAADGSAWYSLDHYRTFIKIRGPNS